MDDSARPSTRKTRVAAAHVPVVTEESAVRKRKRVTGRVRVQKHVDEQQQPIDVSLEQERVEVKRVPVGRIVKRPPARRRRGNVLIIPVVEEVVVVEKRLMLKEELHITTSVKKVNGRQMVTLRKERVEIERLPPRAEDESA